MRARYADKEGYVDRDGVNIFYEIYENDGPTIVLLPTWQIVHSRVWKMQVPYLARHFRVVTFDARGNGKSDRPTKRWRYDESHSLEDAIAVLDETATDRAVFVGYSASSRIAVALAGSQPARTLGIVTIGAPISLEVTAPEEHRAGMVPFEEKRDNYQGWQKYNMHYWRRDYPDFAHFFMSRIFTEPHSTKPIEDGVRWALETDEEVLIHTIFATMFEQQDFERWLGELSCPALFIHGARDDIVYRGVSERSAELAGADLVLMEGSGHAPHTRDPVKVNLMIKEFVDEVLS